MESFKKYHKVEKEITLESKVENDQLFVFYKKKWIRLSHTNNPNKFCCPSYIQLKGGVEFCRQLGVPIQPGEKYSKEVYEKTRESRIKASKKYYAKKKISS